MDGVEVVTLFRNRFSSFLLGLFLLSFLLLFTLAVAVEADSEDHDGDASADNHPKPSRGLKLVEGRFGLLVALLVEETLERKRVGVHAEHTRLKVGAATDDVSGLTRGIFLLERGEVDGY